MKRIFLPLLMISLLGNNLSAMMKEEIITQEQQQNALTIINASGQRIRVSPEHYEHAMNCSVIKRMMEAYDKDNTVILPSESALVSQKNIDQLFDLMGNKINLDQIPEQEIIILFRLADYLEAASILPMLAKKVYKIVQEYPDDNVEKRDLLSLASSCGDAESCGQFITMCGNNTLKKIYDSANGLLTFNYDVINKQIRSLKGIEKIITAFESFDTNTIRIIDMSNQKISNFRIHDLITVFPNLEQLRLTNNAITTITSDQLQGMPRGFKLYLDNNEICSIEDGCFTNFSRFNECIISMQNTKLTAAQEQESFANAQIQEKLNPQGWRAKLTRLSYWSPAAIGSAMVGIGLGMIFLHNTRFNSLTKAYRLDLIGFDLIKVHNSLITHNSAIPQVLSTLIEQYFKAFHCLDRQLTQALSTMIIGYPIFGAGLYSVVGNNRIAAFFQTRNPYHLFVKANHNDYNFPTVHHL